MGFATKMTRSLHGREIGMQILSSAESGGGNGIQRYVVGTFGDVRVTVQTETTSANALPYGYSVASTGSSAVHTIDPPVPGVSKIIASSGGSTTYFKTANSETLESSRGSSFTTVKFQQIGFVELLGLTTARWLIRGSIDSTAVAALTTTT